MIFAITILLTALMLSAVAAFYSITGLIAIFPGVVVPIIIMGGTLEISKIVATVWLHKYWERAGLQFKLYIVPAILILMIITSTGIFGYLSAAHLSQSTETDDISARVLLLDDKIKTERDNIDADKKVLQQMDTQVDQLMGRTTDAYGANRAVQIRKQQSKERKSLQDDIANSQATIAKLQSERAPIAAESRIAESHIGPIKYIAALIYGDNPNADLLERAVRWVIILLVFVFDPLALILILAAEKTIQWAREDKKKRKEEAYAEINEGRVPDSESWPEWVEPTYELDDGPLTEAELDEINRQANVTVATTTSTLFDTEEEFFASGKEIAKELDQQSYLNTPWVWMKNSEGPEGLVPKWNNSKIDIDDNHYSETDEEFLSIIGEDTLQEEPLLADQIYVDESLIEYPMSTNNNDLNTAIELIAELEIKNDELAAQLAELKSLPILDHIGNAISAPQLIQVTAPDLSINTELLNNNVTAGFGTTFPMEPNKGDIYLRVDYLPSKLFKWNGVKWIEIEKASTDRYSYDEAYIKHLIEKIAAGNYDTELLTTAEQEQIQRYLNDTSNQ